MIMGRRCKINNCSECGVQPEFSEIDGDPTELYCPKCLKETYTFGGYNHFNRCIRNWNSFNLLK